MSQFVIYLSDESAGSLRNDMGYWTGESYIHQGEKFLTCSSEITESTKKYTI